MTARLGHGRSFRRLAFRLTAAGAAAGSITLGVIYLVGVFMGGVRPSPLWDLFLGIVVVAVAGAVGALVGLSSTVGAGLAQLVSSLLRSPIWVRWIVVCFGAGCGAALGAMVLVTPLSGWDLFWTPSLIGGLATVLAAIFLWLEQKRSLLHSGHSDAGV